MSDESAPKKRRVLEELPRARSVSFWGGSYNETHYVGKKLFGDTVWSLSTVHEKFPIRMSLAGSDETKRRKIVTAMWLALSKDDVAAWNDRAEPGYTERATARQKAFDEEMAAQERLRERIVRVNSGLVDALFKQPCMYTGKRLPLDELRTKEDWLAKASEAWDSLYGKSD